MLPSERVSHRREVAKQKGLEFISSYLSRKIRSEKTEWWYVGQDQKSTPEQNIKLADRPSKRKKQAGPLSHLIVERTFDLARQHGGSLLRVICVCFCFAEIARATTAFAGKTSAANLVIEVATHLNMTVRVSIAVSLVSSGAFFAEFFRHRNTRKRLTARITKLEKRIDANRSSSGLTNDGMTQPGDL